MNDQLILCFVVWKEELIYPERCGKGTRITVAAFRYPLSLLAARVTYVAVSFVLTGDDDGLGHL